MRIFTLILFTVAPIFSQNLNLSQMDPNLPRNENKATDLMREELERDIEILAPESYNNIKPFKKDETAICIVSAVYDWDNRDQFINTLDLKCNIIEAGEHDIFEGELSQIIIADCTKDFNKKASDTPGLGPVKSHKLNNPIKALPAADCYRIPNGL